MVRNNHPIPKATFAERSFEVRQTLVAVLEIILARANRRSLLAPARLVLAHSQIGDLRLAVHHGGHAPLGGIVGEFDAFGHEVKIFFTTESQRISPAGADPSSTWVFTPVPSTSRAPLTSRRAGPREDRSFSIPNSPPRRRAAGRPRTRSQSFAPFRSRRPKARTPHESPGSARDGCSPCLRSRV